MVCAELETVILAASSPASLDTSVSSDVVFSLATDESTCDVDTSETAPAVLAVSVTASVLVITSALADAELSEETVDFVSVPTAASTALTVVSA